MPNRSNIKIYFENLNAIRFIAAFLVIIHHIEQFKFNYHLPNAWESKPVLMMGKLGVILFFVLSGFLISYLLFKEQEITKTISIKDFYMRRILRIWPLYFAVVLAAFFIFPFLYFLVQEGFEKTVVWENLGYKLLMYIFFLPNLVLTYYGVVPYASQAWSIGAEEQFYLLWAPLNKVFKTHKWVLLSSVIVIYLTIKFYFLFIAIPTHNIRIFNSFWETTPISCMAIGGLCAWLIYEHNLFTAVVKKTIFNVGFQWFALIITILLMIKGYQFPYIHYEVYASLFGVLIVNFAANTKRIFSMENTCINYLGKISYGLYMLHPLAIMLSFRALNHFGTAHSASLYILSIITTILLAMVSYAFFEKRFLNYKSKYSTITSGDQAKEVTTRNPTISDIMPSTSIKTNG